MTENKTDPNFGNNLTNNANNVSNNVSNNVVTQHSLIQNNNQSKEIIPMNIAILGDKKSGKTSLLNWYFYYNTYIIFIT